MTKTCCNHCNLKRCSTVETIGDCHVGPNYSYWRDSRCPACAERERIVEWLRGKDDLTSWMPMVTDAIARGVHLEEK